MWRPPKITAKLSALSWNCCIHLLQWSCFHTFSNTTSYWYKKHLGCDKNSDRIFHNVDKEVFKVWDEPIWRDCLNWCTSKRFTSYWKLYSLCWRHKQLFMHVNVEIKRIKMCRNAMNAAHWLTPMCFLVVSLEGRAVHLATLVQEAEQRVSELQAQVRSQGPSEWEGSDPDRQLKAWEWRLHLFRRMQTGFEHASKSSGWLWRLFSYNPGFHFGNSFQFWDSIWAELTASTLGSRVFDSFSANITRLNSYFTFFFIGISRQA